MHVTSDREAERQQLYCRHWPQRLEQMRYQVEPGGPALPKVVELEHRPRKGSCGDTSEAKKS